MLQRVVVVDDDEMIRSGLRDLIGADENVELVGAAARSADAARIADGWRPDVAVLCITRSDGPGVQSCRRLRSAAASLKCLALTTFDDDDTLLAVIVAGASDYRLQQIGAFDIGSAIRDVCGGRVVFSLPARRATVERLRTSPPGMSPVATLTLAELALLDLLARGDTNGEMASAMAVTERTVDNGVRDLMTRLHMTGITQPDAARDSVSRPPMVAPTSFGTQADHFSRGWQRP